MLDSLDPETPTIRAEGGYGREMQRFREKLECAVRNQIRAVTPGLLPFRASACLAGASQHQALP